MFFYTVYAADLPPMGPHCRMVAEGVSQLELPIIVGGCFYAYQKQQYNEMLVWMSCFLGYQLCSIDVEKFKQLGLRYKMQQSAGPVVTALVIVGLYDFHRTRDLDFIGNCLLMSSLINIWLIILDPLYQEWQHPHRRVPN